MPSTRLWSARGSLCNVLRARSVVLGVLTSVILTVSALTVLSCRLSDREIEAKALARVAGVACALESYALRHGSYPPAIVADEKDGPLHSWRVLILPALGEDADGLFHDYCLTEAWDGPHNRELISRMPEDYRFPSAPVRDYTTHWLRVTGEGTAAPGNKGVRKSEITDDVHFTAAALMVEESDINWSEPRDITLEEAIEALGGRGRYRIKFFSSGKTYFAMLDGFARAVRRESLTPERLRALFTINGNEPMRWLFEDQ